MPVEDIWRMIAANRWVRDTLHDFRHARRLRRLSCRKQQDGQRNDIHIALATPVTGARVVVLMRFLPGNCAGVGRRNGRDTD